MGLALGGLLPCIASVIRHNVPESVAGSILGYSMSAQYTGQVVGPLAGGFVGGHIGMRAVFLGTSVLLLWGWLEITWCGGAGGIVRRRCCRKALPFVRFGWSDCQVALAATCLRVLTMKAVGARPLPAAIAAMGRPEETERSSAIRAACVLGSAGGFVVVFDEQPVGALAAEAIAFHADEDPTAVQAPAVQGEFQVAGREGGFGVAVAFGGPGAAIHSWTVPPPYWPLGMVPSKSP